MQSSRHTAGSLVEPTNDLSVPPPPRPALIAPLGLKRYRVQFTAGAEFCDKLKHAQDLLRHQIPDGDVAEIMDRALTLLVDAVAREKFAATERPRGARADQDGVPGSLTRHIPAEVKRAVWLRDGGRCAYVARGGRRCDARGFLEFHHVVPYAEGGEATVENIELRCRSHNHHEAALRFGEMDSSAPYRDTPPRALPTAARTRMISSARAGPG